MRVTDSHNDLGVKDMNVGRSSRGCLWKREIWSLEGHGQDKTSSGPESVRCVRAHEASTRVYMGVRKNMGS